MKEKSTFSRRQFLIGLSVAGAGVGLAYLRQRPNLINGASDRVRIGIIGLGSSGMQHLAEFSRIPGVEIGALSDINPERLRAAVKALDRPKSSPTAVTDYRRVFDDNRIDAVSVATPNRLHAMIAIAACEAGKDVYLERPCATTFSEGRRLVETASRYRRIVQQRMGTAFAASDESAPFLASPLLGDLTSARGNRWVFANAAASGDLVDQAFDEIDFARTLLNVQLPTRVGAVTFENIRGRTPSRARIQMEFSSEAETKRTLDLEVMSMSSFPGLPGMRAPFAPPASSWPRLSAREQAQFRSLTTLTGSRGDVTVSSVADGNAADVIANDAANFVSCVRQRNAEACNFSVQEARVSCALMQLAQLSVQFKRGFSFDPQTERVIGDQEIDTCLG